MCYTFSKIKMNQLPSNLRQLKGEKISFFFHILPHTYGLCFQSKPSIYLVFHFDNQNPSYFIDTKATIDERQDILHPFSATLKHRYIKEIFLDDLNRLHLDLVHRKDDTKMLSLILQLTPYQPRWMAFQDKQLLFDSILGFNPQTIPNNKQAVLKENNMLALEDLLLHSQIRAYQKIIQSQLDKLLVRKNHLQKDRVIHEKNTHYREIAESIHTNPNQPWITYNNPHNLPLPKGFFQTDFKGINLLFHLYKKAKQGVIKTNEQLLLIDKKIHHYHNVLALSANPNQETVTQLMRFLIEEHLISGTKPKPEIIHHFSPYFVEENSVRYSFGKNAKQNDHLTFTIAKKNDIFMHLQDQPGHHLILHLSTFNHEYLIKGAQLLLTLSNKSAGHIIYAKVGSLKKTKELGKVIVKDKKLLKVNAQHDWATSLLKHIKRY